MTSVRLFMLRWWPSASTSTYQHTQCHFSFLWAHSTLAFASLGSNQRSVATPSYSDWIVAFWFPQSSTCSVQSSIFRGLQTKYDVYQKQSRCFLYKKWSLRPRKLLSYRDLTVYSGTNRKMSSIRSNDDTHHRDHDLRRKMLSKYKVAHVYVLISKYAAMTFPSTSHME
jgi:hypothetical protein